MVLRNRRLDETDRVKQIKTDTRYKKKNREVIRKVH